MVFIMKFTVLDLSFLLSVCMQTSSANIPGGTSQSHRKFPFLLRVAWEDAKLLAALKPASSPVWNFTSGAHRVHKAKGQLFTLALRIGGERVRLCKRRCFVPWPVLSFVTCHWNGRLSEGEVISQLVTQLWNRFSFGRCILSNWIYFPLILLPSIYLWIEASKEKLWEKSFCGFFQVSASRKNYYNLIVKCWKMIYLLFRRTTNGPCLLNSEV